MICKRFIIIPAKFMRFLSNEVVIQNPKIKIYVSRTKIIYCFKGESASLNLICTDHVLAHVTRESCYSTNDYVFRYIDLSEICRITGVTDLIRSHKK